MTGGLETVTLDLPSVSASLPVVRAALREFAESFPVVRLPSRAIEEVVVTLQEACSNVIRHAHRHDPSRRFRVEFVPGPGELEIRIVDHGEPFDLDDVPPPRPEELQEGGYGISIMRAWMDEVTLSREGGCNILRLVRRYRETPQATEVDRAAGV